jgi:hypothetical protein
MTGVAANRLLDSLDLVLNSNSFLLDDRLEEEGMDTASVLADLLSSARFRQLLAQADADRGWRNYIGDDQQQAIDARLILENAELDVREVPLREFRDDLLWLLTTTKSPHQRQLPSSEARTLVDAFLAELADEPTPTSAGNGWQYFQVVPNFLRSSGLAGYSRGALADGDDAPSYFDGGPLDRCLVMRRGPTLHILLTNGAP